MPHYRATLWCFFVFQLALAALAGAHFDHAAVIAARIVGAAFLLVLIEKDRRDDPTIPARPARPARRDQGRR